MLGMSYAKPCVGLLWRKPSVPCRFPPGKSITFKSSETSGRVQLSDGSLGGGQEDLQIQLASLETF